MKINHIDTNKKVLIVAEIGNNHNGSLERAIEMVEKSVVSYGSVQMGLLERGLSWISLFIALAPMLGFMGTVIGMIGAFDAIEAAGDISPSLVAGGIKVALLTEHIPLSSVEDYLNENLIEFRVKEVFKSLSNDFGIKKPKVAVLSIDPHVGDQGVIGNADQKLLNPVLNKLYLDSYDVKGPFASDSFFGSKSYMKFDATVAIYQIKD